MLFRKQAFQGYLDKIRISARRGENKKPKEQKQKTGGAKRK
jgi:hypothetical protein